MRNRAIRNAIRPWQVVLAICLGYLAIVLIAYKDPLEFVRPGLNFDPSLQSKNAEGYDGQFVYYIARDPQTAPRFIDVPAYRFQRILLPIAARVLSLGGRPELLVWVILAINVAALTIGTALLEWLLRQENVSRWYALSYGLFAGVLAAVRFSTNEPLACALVLGALVFARHGSIGGFIVLIALSILAKETSVLFGVGYGLYFVSQRKLIPAILLGVLTTLPFIAWQGVLYVHFGSFGVGSGGANATPFEIIPFMGVLRILEYGAVDTIINWLIVIPAVVFPTLWALYYSLRDIRRGRFHAYVFILLANAAIMPFVPFSTYREPLGILRFIPGLIISILLFAALRRMRRPLRYSFLWILFGFRVIG